MTFVPQMPRFQHPLLYSEHAHIPKDQREQLACCCLGGCKRPLEGRKPSAVWQTVEERPAAAEGSSSSTSYTAGKLELGAAPLHPVFHDPASRHHGQWACIACARRRAMICEAKAAAATESAALQPETDPNAAFPHHLPSSQPSSQSSPQLGRP